MTRLSGKLDAYVLMLRPKEMDEAWTHSDLWRSAQAIPGVHVQEDVDGAEAARFGAYTSGQVVLYAANGALLFRGGMTGSRGHEGDNAGEERIISLVTRGTSDSDHSSVYGCSLQAAR
jgi:hypothetical protein